MASFLLPHHSTFRQDSGGRRGSHCTTPRRDWPVDAVLYFSILTALFLAVDLRRAQCKRNAGVELCYLPSPC